MAADNSLDTTIAVVTPENIAFEYQLAGPFRRLPAYLIDVAVRWGILAVAMFLLMFAGVSLSFFSQLYTSAAIAIFVVLLFLVTWFYGTIMEAYYNGRTIGKWACGIRVVDIEGRPVSGRSALLRNLLRVADMMPVAALSQVNEEIPPIFILSTGMLGLISMTCTKRMQRLGDLVGGTMVIIDERAWRLPVAKVDDPRVPALSAYFPGDYRVSRTMARTLAVYAERRHYLTPARRREIARHLTDPLISRFEFRPDIDPDLLLYALYYKTFLADSNTEEPDLGPLRGYSPLARDANKPGAADANKTIAADVGKLSAADASKPSTGSAGSENEQVVATIVSPSDSRSTAMPQAGSNIAPPSKPPQPNPDDQNGGAF